MKIILSGVLSRTRYSEYVGPRDSRLAFADGFRRLGHDVYFFEEVGVDHCLDHKKRVVPFERWDGRRVFGEAMSAYGMTSHSALIYDAGAATDGLAWEECCEVAADADLLVAIGGRFRVREILDGVRHRAYIDINPGKTQAYAFEYDVDYGLDAFDTHFSVGLSIGRPECPLPTGGLDWRPLLWPVVLDRWRPTSAPGEAFSTLSTWGRKYQFSFQGQQSGDKVEQWIAYLALPGSTGQSLELALPVAQMEREDVEMLASSGWTVTDAGRLRTLSDYVGFVSRSRAEFSVANGRYTKFQTGWFSDRTARYLSAGRPALVQSTGIESHVPVGEGLLTFDSLEEATERIREINADYEKHSRKALSLAREFLDSDRVLTGLLETVGLA